MAESEQLDNLPFKYVKECNDLSLLLHAYNNHQQQCSAYQGVIEFAQQQAEEVARQEEATRAQEHESNTAAPMATATSDGGASITAETQLTAGAMDSAPTQAHAIIFSALHTSHHQALQDLITSGASETDLQAAAFRWMMAAIAGAHDHN